MASFQKKITHIDNFIEKRNSRYQKIYESLHRAISKEKIHLEHIAQDFYKHQHNPQGQFFVREFLGYIEKYETVTDETQALLLAIIRNPAQYISRAKPSQVNIELLQTGYQEKQTKLIQEVRELEEKIAQIRTQGITLPLLHEILSRLTGFQFLAKSIDLGEPKLKLPIKIPPEKKWQAGAYPKDWTPAKKVTTYLTDNWMHCPVSREFFTKKRMYGLIEYIRKNDLDHLILTECEMQILIRLYQSFGTPTVAVERNLRF